MRIRFYGMMMAALFLLTKSFSQTPSYTQYVDPFIGTGGHGHTFPGATLPFGMVQLSPDTRLEGWDGCGGYHYSDSVIYGFSHTHLSGTGIADYCDFLFMPTVGKPVFQNLVNGNYRDGYASHFHKSSEKAAPGYYAVHLDDDNIDVELTATTRVGYHKYVYPSTDQANIIIDLTHRDEVLDSYIKIVDSRHIEGYRRSRAWAQNEIVYFYAELSKPMDRFAIAMNDSIVKGITEAQGKNVKACLQFHTANQEAIYAKVALSFTGMNEAMRNLQSECPSQSFDLVRRSADAAWNAVLSTIDVRGGTDTEKKIFYSALYHCMIAPNITSDVDGTYLGRDFKTHKTNSKYYSVFSLWDTFRALHPLMTIIAPDRDVDFILTFLLQYDQGGLLPVWELCSNETNCMIGYHSVSVIADAAMKNMKGFDLHHALDAMKSSALQNDSGLNALRRNGFISMNDDNASVSKTVEYSYDDWCIAQVAKLLKDTSDYRTFIKYAQSWKNIFNPESGFMQPRNNGMWRSPFDPFEVNFNYTEGNAWQYSFFVPQDIQNLISMMGGTQRFDAKLDSLFSVSSKTSGLDLADVSGMIGQYAHGNEPSHHMAYLYDYIGKPWKTEKLVRKIMDSLYRAAPDGLAGNEDCGQMSAWYVMSAMGIYEVTPGLPYYAIGSPLFDSIFIHLDNGKTFTIISHSNSTKNIYIQSMKVNGQPADSFLISHKMILSGSRIDYEMSDEPNYSLVNLSATSPHSAISDFPIVIVPAISALSPFFADSTTISFSSPQKDVKFLYTIDGSAPSQNSALFMQPFTIKQNTTVRAFAVDSAGKQSNIVSGIFTRLSHNWNVNYITHYDNQYNGGGDFALVDGVSGSRNLHDGTWQGWEGKDMQVIIDLGQEEKFSEVGAEFLQDANAWVMMPKAITVEVSDDGVHFEAAGKAENKISDRDEDPQHQLLTVKSHEHHARYVRITAANYGKLPAWHRGAGGDAWIFCDEIFIQ